VSDELEPASTTWKQDGLPIERVEARLSGTIGVIDQDANALMMGSTGVLVCKFRIYEAGAKENKRTGDILRKVVLDVDEARVVHDAVASKQLLIDLHFEDTEEPISATATPVVPALPPAGGVDPETGEYTPAYEWGGDDEDDPAYISSDD
jgi:hypothetical protein